MLLSRIIQCLKYVLRCVIFVTNSQKSPTLLPMLTGGFAPRPPFTVVDQKMCKTPFSSNISECSTCSIIFNSTEDYVLCFEPLSKTRFRATESVNSNFVFFCLFV